MDYTVLKEQIFKLLKADVWNGWYYFLFYIWIFAIFILSIAIVPILAVIDLIYPLPDSTIKFCITMLDLIWMLERAMIVYLVAASTIDLYLWLDEGKKNKTKVESKP